MMPRALAVFGLALVASCATPATKLVRVAEPAPCADSTYVQLKRQHPDSLFERGWQQPQSRDRACTAARDEATIVESRGTMDASSHGGRRMWLGAVAMMVAMIFAMR